MPPPPPDAADTPTDPRARLRAWVFAAAVLATLTPWLGPPAALALGVAIALAGLAAYPHLTRRWARTLIQTGVVLLGLRMDLHKVAEAGLTGVAFAAGTIALTFAAGALAGRLLRVERKTATLVSSGTAICGGSAISATGSVIAASESQMAVAMGCVFILNSIGLLVFPPLGAALGLSAEQFGTWAAVAVHDISSVVGSAAVFDRAGDQMAQSLPTATAVKLSRTLWIVPVALAAGWWHRRIDARERSMDGEDGPPSTAHKRQPLVPWFIGLFLLAAAVRTILPELSEADRFIKPVAEKLLTLALLMIGMGMSVKALASVGWRAMALAVSLWVLISGVSLLVVLRTLG